MNLSEFLLARIAEDEARVDSIPEWYCTNSARGDGWGSRGECPLCGQYMFDGTESATKEAFWDHYEDAHRRTRVLAECDAKRRIVARWSQTAPPYADSRQQEIHETLDEEVLPLLALPYAAYPDYDQAWRP